MKQIVLLLLGMAVVSLGNAQDLFGAWEGNHSSETGAKLTTILIFAEGYNVKTTFETQTGKFVATKGGSWRSSDGTLIEKIEFDSNDPESVGTEARYAFSITGLDLKIEGSGMDYKRIDNGTPGALNGAWLMSGRVVDGKNQVRDTGGPRKTMKILSGTRFQWIAYNTETKQFLATGGGTYTTVDGEYTENIGFFSRDNSRVGMELKFSYELIDGNWRHSGKSSKGDPIDEIWSKRI